MVIYKIVNNLNGMPYIGQTTKTVAERVQRHINGRSKIGKAIRKYGKENFTIEVIDHATNQQELDELERYWIAFFNARENGYNTLLGGKPTKDEFKLLAKIPKTKRKKKNKKLGIDVEQEKLLKDYISLFGDSEGIRIIFSTKLTDRQIKFFKNEIESFKKERL